MPGHARNCPILPKLYITRITRLSELIFGTVIQNHEGNALKMVIYVKGTQVAQACPELPDFAQIIYKKNN